MGWAADIAPAVIETFHGAFPGAVPLACVAIDPEATVVELDGAPPDGRFEVGSLTKTMTGTLLARLAGEGLVELDENIGRWVAAGPHGEITLRQLATHTSVCPGWHPARPPGRTIRTPTSPNRWSSPRCAARNAHPAGISPTPISATRCWGWRWPG